MKHKFLTVTVEMKTTWNAHFLIHSSMYVTSNSVGKLQAKELSIACFQSYVSKQIITNIWTMKILFLKKLIMLFSSNKYKLQKKSYIGGQC